MDLCTQFSLFFDYEEYQRILASDLRIRKPFFYAYHKTTITSRHISWMGGLTLAKFTQKTGDQNGKHRDNYLVAEGKKLSMADVENQFTAKLFSLKC